MLFVDSIESLPLDAQRMMLGFLRRNTDVSLEESEGSWWGRLAVGNVESRWRRRFAKVGSWPHCTTRSTRFAFICPCRCKASRDPGSPWSAAHPSHRESRLKFPRDTARSTAPASSLDKSEAPTRDPLWVESSDQKDAARALEMLHVQLISAVIDPYSWKWVIVTLHHTPSGLRDREPGGAGVRRRTPGHASGDERPLPGRHQLRGAALRVPLGALPAYEAGDGVPAGPEIDRDLARMVECRDVFVQAIPSSWRLRVNEMPRATQNCLRIVEFLGWSRATSAGSGRTSPISRASSSWLR